MTTAYVPPGVTIQELTSTTLTPLLAIPGSVCLVGMSAGSITRTDTIQIYGTVAESLPNVPAGSVMSATAIVQVISALQPSLAPNGFQPTTDYTFNASNYTVSRVVTSQALATNAAQSATSFTLASGAVPSVGQTVSLSNQAATFTANTNGTNLLGNLSSLTGLAVGQTVTGTGIPGGTTILALNTAQNSATLSNAATTIASAVSITASNLELQTVSGVTGQIVSIANAAGLTYAHTATTPTACAVTWGNIPDGTTLYVTYSYTPSDYYRAIRLTNMSDIQQRFGDVWDPTGTVINSPISYAANLAFQNGASNVVLQPLYFVNSSTGALQQPTPAQAANAANWSTVFTGLLALDDINLIVPVIGQSAPNVTDSVMLQIEQAAQDYLFQALNGENQYRLALVGEDSSASSSVAQETTLQTHAQTLIPRYGGQVTEQMVFINTSNFTVPNIGGTIQIGGQYVAAAIAGMVSARKPSATVTRQAIAGITAVTDIRNAAQRNADASNGMLVVEARGNVVQVRHGITMDMTSAATRELNVVRGKHYVLQSIQKTLETQVIGILVADADAPTLLNNVVIATLTDLQTAGDISSYSGVSSQIASFDPTTMAVRFQYLPVFIVNYINVTFSLDLTSQTITATSTTTSSSNG